MKHLAFGYSAIALGLALGGCSNNDSITATALPAPIVKIDQVPTQVKGSSPIQVDFSSEVVAQKKIVSVNFLYSADGTNFIPVANVATDSQSYRWEVPRIDSSSAKVKIVAKDSRGFTSEKTSNSFAILSTPPNITVTSNNGVVSSASSITFSGTCKPGDAITFFGGLTPQTSAAVKAHYATIVAPTCSDAGTWSLTANETTLNTTFSYTLQQADVVGNSTQVSFTWTRTCTNTQYADGETCRPQVCSPSSIGTDQTGCSSAGTRTRSCSANGSAWGDYSACSCSTGYTGTTCSSCAAGYFFNGTSCVAQVCAPGAINTDTAACSSHGTRSETCAANGSGFGSWTACGCAAGYTGVNCASCSTGYYPNGSACVAEKCTPSAMNSDSSGCSNHGTRSQSCAANGSDWNAYGACACNTGYSGATCSTCSSGYFFNGTSCVADVCTPSQVVSDTSACSNNGTRSHSCASDGSAWGTYSACACSAGYAGANCATCDTAAGYTFNGSSCVKVVQVCTPNTTQTVTATCSNHGTSTQTCAADGSAWGAAGACSCASGFNGSDCSSCAANFYFDGSGCSAQICAPSAAQTDTSACSNHGLRSQSCAANGSQWSAWSSCGCTVGYAGADCSACDTASGFTLTSDGSCKQLVNVNYSLNEAGAATQNVYVDANLNMVFPKTALELYTNTTGTITLNSGDSVQALCFAQAAWPTTNKPGITLSITDQNGNQIFNHTTYDPSKPFSTSFTVTYGNTYNIDCHSVRSPTNYQIGVHYNPVPNPICISTSCGAAQNDPAIDYTNVNEDWYQVAEDWFVGNPNRIFPSPASNSIGYMDWMWVSLRTMWGFDQGHTGIGFSPGGVRVKRTYPEREPLLRDDRGNLVPTWFEYFHPDEMQKQLDSMRESGIDFVAVNLVWNPTAYCFTSVPWNLSTAADVASTYLTAYPQIKENAQFAFAGKTANNMGCISYSENLNALIEGNKTRDPSRQVLTAIEYNDAPLDQILSSPIYTDNPQAFDYRELFKTMIQFYIDHYFNATDQNGNALYLFHNQKPVLFFYDTASLMRSAAHFNVSLSELVTLGNQLAVKAGYPGIWWVDTLNTIVDSNLNVITEPRITDFTNYQDIVANAGFNASTTYNYHGVCQLLTGHQFNNGVYSIDKTGGNYDQNCHFWNYGEEITTYSAIWTQQLANAKKHPGFKYFLPVSPGWDSRAVGEGAVNDPHDMTRSCDGGNNSSHNSDAVPYGCSKDGALFSTMLSKAKTAIDSNKDTTDEVLMIGTWNEFGEGTYVMPTVGDQGAHAQAIHDVFKPTGN